MSKIKLSKLLAGLSALFAFVMIFTNFGAAITCNVADVDGAMIGTPSIFNIMFGGFEGFKEHSSWMVHYVPAVAGLQVAFAFEIVATVFFVVALVFHFLNKADNKIISLLSLLAVAFILTSTILTFCTKAMTHNAIITHLNDNYYGQHIVDIMNDIFNKNISLGSGVIVTGIFGIFSLGTQIASRYILKSAMKAAQ